VRPPPNRLPAEGEHRLKGAAIDRSKPLRFRLDGRTIHGFEGDTVLSAALACGLIGVGTRDGPVLALDERFAPLVEVVRRGGATRRDTDPLPMHRVPAIDGLVLRTVGKRRGVSRVAADLVGRLPTHRDRLGRRYGDEVAAAPWRDTLPGETLTADVAVIGGGLAGIAAALAAAEAGRTVVLIESRPWLGGIARLFGATGDEEAPEASIERLSGAVAAQPGIRVLLASEAFGVFPELVRVHRVTIEGKLPVGQVVAVAAPGIVLANGRVERLPVFAGNRLPGVVGAEAAFERAERFGVWIGHRAVVATATSIAYRLATQIKSEAVDVLRVVDARVNPQSRFVDFGKAYGIPQIQDAIPTGAAPEKRRRTGLRVTLMRRTHGVAAPLESIAVDQLVAAGGWQADLTLWHMAGGMSRWDEGENRFVAEGSLPGVALAGSVAGFETATACQASGRAAVAALLGEPVPAIADRRIEPQFETPDAATPIAPALERDLGRPRKVRSGVRRLSRFRTVKVAPPSAGKSFAETDPAYLDGGTSLITRPTPARGDRRRPRRHQPRLADDLRALSLCDVAAAVQLGIIPADQAAAIAQERCVTPGNLIDAGRQAPSLPQQTEVPLVPPYLRGRFGSEAVVRAVSAADGRRFDVGCLIYRNADETDPRAAIGVILGAGPTGVRALVQSAADLPATVSVRDISGPVAARLGEPVGEAVS
jgi:sarcosine oxidase subunit alpha